MDDKLCKCRGDLLTGYNERHDAIFCRKCRRFVESQCNDPECEYCAGRPEFAPISDDEIAEAMDRR